MAAAKCRLCKAKLTTTKAYKTTIDGKSAYFCDEKHYAQFLSKEMEEEQKKIKAKELQNKFVKLFCEILGVNGITNTALWKEKAELNKVFSDEVIIDYLEENKEWLTKSVSRLNGGEFGRIRYIGTILRNKLGDYRTNVTVKNTFYVGYCADEHYETKFKLKPRQSLLELEEDCYE